VSVAVIPGPQCVTVTVTVHDSHGDPGPRWPGRPGPGVGEPGPPASSDKLNLKDRDGHGFQRPGTWTITGTDFDHDPTQT
jgi:hypothetical protein